MLGNVSPPVLAAFCIVLLWLLYAIVRAIFGSFPGSAIVRLREVEGDLQEPQILSSRSHIAAPVRHVSSMTPAYSGFVVLPAADLKFIGLRLIV